MNLASDLPYPNLIPNSIEGGAKLHHPPRIQFYTKKYFESIDNFLLLRDIVCKIGADWGVL